MRPKNDFVSALQLVRYFLSVMQSTAPSPGPGDLPPAPRPRVVAAVIVNLVIVAAITGAVGFGASAAHFASWSMWSLTALAAILSIGALAWWQLLRGAAVGELLVRIRWVSRRSGLPVSTVSADAMAIDLRCGVDPLHLAPRAQQTPVARTEHMLGVISLQFDDGTIFPLTGTAVIGRDPIVFGAQFDHITVPDFSRSMGRAHALVRLTGAPHQLIVTDLGDPGGTWLLHDSAPTRLASLEPQLVEVGQGLQFGSRRAWVGMADAPIAIHEGAR